MQFREMALGGSQEVPGQSVAAPVVPSGAIAQHLFCILYFVFMSNSEKKHVHKLAHFYNEEGIDSKGDKSKMMNFHQPVISSAASS